MADWKKSAEQIINRSKINTPAAQNNTKNATPGVNNNSGGWRDSAERILKESNYIAPEKRTYELKTDTRSFGTVSYEAYKAVTENKLHTYKPKDEAEKKILDEVKDYIEQTTAESKKSILQDRKNAIWENSNPLKSYNPTLGEARKFISPLHSYADRRELELFEIAKTERQKLLSYDVEGGAANIDKLSNDVSRIEELTKKISEAKKWITGYEKKAKNNTNYRYRYKHRYDTLTQQCAKYQNDINELTALYGGASLSELQEKLRETRVYHDNAKQYQAVYRMESEAIEAEDFEKYSSEGAAIENPTFAEKNRTIDFFGIEMSGWPNSNVEVGNVVTYSRDYEKELRGYGDHIAGRGGDPLYAHMTDDQVKIYNYYLAKYGKEDAEKYLNLIYDDLKKIEAKNLYDQYNDTVAEPVVNLAANLDAFVANVTQGIPNLVTGNDDEISYSPIVYASQTAMSDNEGLWKLANDVVATTGNMLPSILVGIINPVAGAAVMGVSTAGNAYNEMIQLGYSTDQAQAYGVLVGASEASLQYLLGGINKLGGKATGKVATSVATKLDNALAKLAITHPHLVSGIKTTAQLGISTAGEIVEEELQLFLEPLFKSWAANEVYLSPDFEEIAYTALVTALSTGVLEGPSTVAKGATTFNQNKQFGKSIIESGQLDALKDLGKTSSDGTAAHQFADLIDKDTNGYAVAQYFEQVREGLSDQNIKDIAKGLERRGYTAEKANTVAGYINKALNGEELSRTQRNAIYGDEAVVDVIRSVLFNENHSINQRNAELDKMGHKAGLETANRANAKNDKTATADAVAEKASAVPEAPGVTPYNVFAEPPIYAGDTFKDSKTGNTITVVKRDSDKTLVRIDTGSKVEMREISNSQANKLITNEQFEFAKSTTRTEIAAERAALQGKNATIEDYASEYGNGAQTLLDAYNLGGNSQETEMFAREYEIAYSWGESGVTESYISKPNAKKVTSHLTDRQREIAFNSGRNAMEESVRAIKSQRGTSNETSNGISGHKRGRLSGYNVKVRDVQLTFGRDFRGSVVNYLRTFADVTGIDIVLYKSTVGADGKLVGAVIDGVDLTDAQGGFSWRNNKIYVDINAGIVNAADLGDIQKYSLLRTFAHEFTHFCEKWDPEAYNAFRALVFEYLDSKGVDVHERIEVKQAQTGERYERASREVVADAMTDILPETRFAEKLLEKNRTLYEKLFSWLKKFLRDIKMYFGDLYANDDFAANELKESVDGTVRYVESIVKAYDALALKAVENYQGDANNGTDVKKETVSKQARPSEEHNDYEKPITEADVNILRSIGRKSINEFTSEDIEKAQKWAYKFYGDLKLKSPFFRAWFGDWRAYDTSVAMIAKIPVYVGTNESRKENRGTVTNAETGWNIRISREGETNTISHSGTERFSEYGLAGIQELVKNAVLFDSEVHEHHSNNAKNDLIVFDHKLYTLGRDADGNISLYRITVEDYFQSKSEPSNKRFHNLKYIEKIAENVGGRTFEKARSGGSTNDTSTTVYSIADLYGFVKTYDKEFTPAPEVNATMLNADGTPKRFYHGTNEDFTVFDHTKGKKKVHLNALGDGNYFTARLEGAERYGERIVDAYLNIKKPYIFKGSEYSTVAEQISAEYGIERYSFKGSDVQNILKAKGFDGVLLLDENGETVMANAFDSTQIKSATDNIGAFDDSNPDIRYQKRTAVLSDGEASQSRYRSAGKEVKSASDNGTLDNGSTVGYNGDIKDGENYAEKDEGHDSGRGEQSVYGSAEGTSPQNGNRSRVQEENRGRIGAFTEEALPGRLNSEKQEKSIRFPRESIIVPRSGSVEHSESRILTEEYGVETYVIKKSAWNKKTDAASSNGIVYICEDAKIEHLGVIAPHEATHVMKQLKYAPYMHFLERTPVFLDVGTSDFGRLLEIIERHLKTDVIDSSNISEERLYDELNAAAYGSYVAEAKAGRVWNEFPDAFYDFDAYISELAAIHEQFKRDNTTAGRKNGGAENDTSIVRGADDTPYQISKQRRTNTMSDREVLEAASERIDTEKLTEDERAALDTFKKQLHDGKALQTVLSIEDKRVLKDVLSKARDIVREDTAKYYKAKMQETRTHRDEKLAAQRKHFAEVRERERERRDMSTLREKIKGTKAKLEKMLLSPTESRYVPQGLASAIVDVCGLINTDTDAFKKDGSVNKAQAERELTRQKLQALKDEYEKFRDIDDAMYKGEFDEYIYDYITQLRDGVGNKALSGMSLDELWEMCDILTAISETLSDARKLIGYGETVTAYEFGNGIISEQAEVASKRKNGELNAARGLTELANMLSLSPVRAVERMSGYAKDSYLLELFRGLEKGVRKKNKFVMDSYTKFEKLTAGENVKNYENAMYKPGDKVYTDKFGRKFKITDMQKMQAILTWEREKASNFKTRHIEGGGLRFADLDLLRKGDIKNAVSDQFAHHILGGDSVKLINDFKLELAKNEWAQAYMATAREYFNGMAKDAINETTLTLKHRIVAKESAYIPFVVAKSFTAREISSTYDVQQTVNSFGMLKDIKPSSKNPLVMSGLNNILDRHIEEVGTVYGLAVPVRNFNKVWNVQDKARDTSVQESVGRNWGDGGKNLIEQAVKDVQGARVDTQGQLYKELKSNIISSTFTFNLSVVTKQIGSLFSATSMLEFRDPVSMLGNLVYTMAHIKDISAEVNKYTASAWMRAQGLSDAELRTLATQAQKGAVTKLFDKLPTGFSPQKWITAMDYSVALSLWKYAKQDVAKRTGLKGEELLKATAEFYDSVIENTQSMSDSLHRPEIQKRKDIISESFAMFKTDLYQMSGQLQTAAGRYMADKSKENKAALSKTLYSVAMSAIWTQAMTALWAAVRYSVKRYRDDEDELTAESWFKRIGFALAGDFVGYLVPLCGSEIVGLAEAAFYGETDQLVDNLVVDAISDFTSAVYTVVGAIKDQEWPSIDQARKISERAFAMFGVPAKNVFRTVNAVQLHMRDIAAGEFLSFNSDPSLPKGKRIYIAASRGEEKELGKLRSTYKTEDSYETAVRKALRENDERIREAAEARIDGNFGEYDRIVHEIEDEGNFDGKLISEAIFSEEEAIKEAANPSSDTKDVDNNEDEDDEAYSIYKTNDICRMLDSGDKVYAKRVVDELIAMKVTNGSTEKDAKKSLKSALTKYYKDAYIAADEVGRQKIRMALWNSGLYEKPSDVKSLVDGWVKGK